MRCDQYIGLNDRGHKLVAGESVQVATDYVTRHYHDGRVVELPPQPVKEYTVKKDERGVEFYGMFDDPYPLYEYTMSDGRVLKEYLQDEIWSSGPMFFIALLDENDNIISESLWTEEEMQRY